MTTAIDEDDGIDEDARLVDATVGPRPISRIQAAALVVVYLAIAIGRGVDQTWDYRHYHLAIGWSVLTGHLPSPDWVVAGSMSFLNPTLDAGYVVLGQVHPWLAHVTYSMFGLATCFVVVHLIAATWPVERPIRTWMRLGVALVAVLGVDAIGQIGSTMDDLTLALPVASGALLIYRSLGEHAMRRKRDLVLGCVLLGAAMGLKITLIPISVGLTIGTVAAVVAARDRPELSSLRPRDPVIGLVLGWFSTGSFWAAYMWVRFGNPIFPFMNDIFRSKWASTESWSTPYQIPWHQLAFFPVRVSTSIARHRSSPYEFIEPRFAIGFAGSVIFVATIVKLGRARGDWREDAMASQSIFLCGGWLVAYLFWATALANSRYAIPLLALAVPCLLQSLRWSGLSTRSATTRGFAVPALAVLLSLSSFHAVASGTPDWGPRTMAPTRPYEFPGGPTRDGRNPLITTWKWQDVVIISDRWPLGFLVLELEPHRVWNLRERGLTKNPEDTRFATHVRENLDRAGSIVAFDPRFDDLHSIRLRLSYLLAAEVEISSCGLFDGDWTPAKVCRFSAGSQRVAPSRSPL